MASDSPEPIRTIITASAPNGDLLELWHYTDGMFALRRNDAPVDGERWNDLGVAIDELMRLAGQT